MMPHTTTTTTTYAYRFGRRAYCSATYIKGLLLYSPFCREARGETFNPLLLIHMLATFQRDPYIGQQLKCYSNVEIVSINHHLKSLIDCCEDSLIRNGYDMQQHQTQNETIAAVLEKIVLSPSRNSVLQCLLQCTFSELSQIHGQLWEVQTVSARIVYAATNHT